MKNKHNKIAKEIKTTEPLKDKSTKKKKTTRSNDNSLIKMHSTSSFIDHIDTRKKNKSIKLHTSPSPLTKSLSKEKR